ncbi:unnamed protein product [Hydatigera taeniaeformis]|uniref:Uncharacterized protein n=1 Tax=Hydatigena taeniaeformis TaxID=6205 RepID=A0A0R3X5A9_HYDTA|nr:unnamed protein product [Hydatigera taeniaeformis]
MTAVDRIDFGEFFVGCGGPAGGGDGGYINYPCGLEELVTSLPTLLPMSLLLLLLLLPLLLLLLLPCLLLAETATVADVAAATFAAAAAAAATTTTTKITTKPTTTALFPSLHSLHSPCIRTRVSL